MFVPSLGTARDDTAATDSALTVAHERITASKPFAAERQTESMKLHVGTRPRQDKHTKDK
jgi:hypothetical protein